MRWHLPNQFLAVCVLLTSAASADDSLRVLSYNVQFLPGPGKLFNARGNDTYRSSAIGQAVKDFDIIGFNEVFEVGPRGRILSELKTAWGDAYHASECPEPGPKVGRYNAGLTIAARFPIVDTGFIAYSQASTRKEFGVFADEFAAKGALHARVRVRDNPALEIDVFTTHLDSKLERVRTTQVAELAEFAKKRTDPSRPILFLGDFNIRGNPKAQADPQSEYSRLMEKLKSVRPSVQDLWIVLGEGEGGTSEPGETVGCSRIDYVFWARADSGNWEMRPKSIAVQFFPDSKVKFLSDHSAVEALFDLQRSMEK